VSLEKRLPAAVMLERNELGHAEGSGRLLSLHQCWPARSEIIPVKIPVFQQKCSCQKTLHFKQIFQKKLTS